MSEENGSLAEFPNEVFKYYKKKFSIDITPSYIKEITGEDRINIEKYDIYIMGKKKGEKENCYWTKLRILASEYNQDSLQGLLEIKMIAGFGFVNTGSTLDTKIMRPTNIQQNITRDSVAFKKRAIVHIKGNLFLPLDKLDSHLNIPDMKEEKLSKFEKASNSRKREAYARKKINKNEWAHINRESLKSEHRKILIKMVTPYKKNLGTDEYWSEFRTDLINVCCELDKEYTGSSVEKEVVLKDLYANLLTTTTSNKRKKSLDVASDDIIVDKNYPKINSGLKRIPLSKVKW